MLDTLYSYHSIRKLEFETEYSTIEVLKMKFCSPVTSDCHWTFVSPLDSDNFSILSKSEQQELIKLINEYKI